MRAFHPVVCESPRPPRVAESPGEILRVKGRDGDLQYRRNRKNLHIRCAADLRFNLCQGAPRNGTARHLALRRQRFLRPSPLVAELPDDFADRILG